MNLSKLHDAISAVCPISGVYIGNETDKNTWGFNAIETATAEEIAAAQAVIDAADLTIIDDVREISKLVIVDRLIALGKIEDAMTALNANAVAKLRWDAAVSVKIDDPDVIALLQAISVNLEDVLY